MNETTSSTQGLNIDGIGPVELTVTECGEGRPVLLLHGGAGPQSVTEFAELFAATEPVRIIIPTHPGFGGTSRPEKLTSIAGLAAVYGALLDQLEVDQVTVIGNSIGGWIAAEMALLGSARIREIVLVDAVGIEVKDHPVADFFSLTLDQVPKLSYHDSDRFRIDPAAMPEALRAVMATNRAALAVYGGQQSMPDPTLSYRLQRVTLPTLVAWGESDRIADPDYGRAYSSAIPNARFQLLPKTGHVPQVETPEELLAAIRAFSHGHEGHPDSEQS